MHHSYSASRLSAMEPSAVFLAEGGYNDEKKWFQVVKEEICELRWRVLVAVCFLTFGSYYVFDFPGSIGIGGGGTIEQHFKSHGKAYTQEMNQLLYSVYSWPNTVLAILGGLLIDKYLGIRMSMLLFTFLVFLGGLLFWVGICYVNYPLLIVSRVIFGLGGESLSAAQSAYVSRWFKNRRGMALAFGITISFSRVGSSFNFFFSPKIANAENVDVATLVGVLACLISFAVCVILVYVDMFAVRSGYISSEQHDEEEDVTSLADALRLPFSFWILTIICVFCYCAIFPFIGISKNFFEIKYGHSSDKASSYISAYQIASAAGSPLIGIVVDSVGRNTLWLIMSSACFILIHVLLITTNISGIVVMISMGCVYSILVSGLWPSIPWAVGDNIMGLSYGIMTAVQNTGLTIFPIVVGHILDRYTEHVSSETTTTTTTSSLSLSLSSLSSMSTSGEGGGGDDRPPPSLKGYEMTEILFIAASGMALVASIVLLIADVCGGGVLTASSTRRKEMEEKKQNAILDSLLDNDEDFFS